MYENFEIKYLMNVIYINETHIKFNKKNLKVNDKDEIIFFKV